MRTTILGVMLCLLIVSGTPAHAEEPGLFKQIGTKFVRGVANITTGWAEIPKQVYLVGKNEGWVAGVFRGPFDGIGMFFARTVAGAYEILTFPVPVPSRYQPMVQPEYVWEPEPSAPSAASSSGAEKTAQVPSQ